jgi:hypothetical protein
MHEIIKRAFVGAAVDSGTGESETVCTVPGGTSR